MSKFITPFDPNAASTGTFLTSVVNRCSSIVLFNESNCILSLLFEDGRQEILTAWTVDRYLLKRPSNTVQWSVLATLGSAGAPSSAVYGIAYEHSEHREGVYPMSLPRQTNVGNVVSVATNSGTAFPAGPDVNDQFFRTDRSQLYFYDGAEWLTVAEYPVAWATMVAGPPYTASGQWLYGMLPQDYSIFISRISVGARVINGVNDTPNHWFLLVRTVNTSGTLDLLVSSETTFAPGINNWYTEDFVINLVSAPVLYVYFGGAKAGLPGDVETSVVFYYRLVG